MTSEYQPTFLERQRAEKMALAREATASRLSPYGSSCQHRITIAGGR